PKTKKVRLLSLIFLRVKRRTLKEYTQKKCKSFNLLPSRLYCRYWNFTRSDRCLAFVAFTTGRVLHPALKQYCILFNYIVAYSFEVGTSIVNNHKNSETESSTANIFNIST